MVGSEVQLVEQAVNGDTQALTQLLEQYGPAVRDGLRIDRKWSAALDVDDVLQVTYLEVFLHIQDFRPAGPAAFLGWLRRIADNNLRDAIRGLERQKRPPPAAQLAAPAGGESVVALFEVLGFTTTTPSRDAALGEMKSALEHALGAMPEDYATAIRLYDLEGRPIAEAARCMNRSPGAVHMLRARAHEQLRGLLGPASNFFSQTA